MIPRLVFGYTRGRSSRRRVTCGRTLGYLASVCYAAIGACRADLGRNALSLICRGAVTRGATNREILLAIEAERGSSGRACDGGICLAGVARLVQVGPGRSDRDVQDGVACDFVGRANCPSCRRCQTLLE